MDNLSESKRKLLKKLFLAVSEIGFDFSDFIQNQERRIEFQKIVYALQRSKIKFAYNYNLYIHGPYSPSLADDGYYIARNFSEFSDAAEQLRLTQKGQERINDAKEFLKNRINDIPWLETLTTIDYLYNEIGIKKQEKLISKFKELKPQFADNNERIVEALEQIQGNR
ncbi:MAG: hypothetical protein ABFC57_03305 [Veillonellales bacterium]